MRPIAFTQVKRIHFIGIGGAGMGGIAEVLMHQGYEITGSDQSDNAMVQRLRRFGIKIWQGHSAENIKGADVIVTSSAITDDNCEVLAAKEARLPVIPRARMLADLMRFKRGIAIAGTHGKTTTTSLVASIFAEAGLDPTFVIGGLLKSAGAHAHLGGSEYFIAEADESDASFLYLSPQAAIVTNIDADHMCTYQGDFATLKQTFIEFLHRLPFNGLAVVCYDEPVIREIMPEIARPTVTYGFSEQADIHISDFQQTGIRSQFKLQLRDEKKALEVTLNLPGRHNALNAAAAYAIALHAGIGDRAIKNALAKFAGVGRRFQIYGEFETGQGKVILVDDYGHHPREINVTLEAARKAWPDRRLVVAYQPHRYTRTRDLFQDFVTVLSDQVDKLVLLDIYSAGETPLADVNGDALFKAIQERSNKEPVFVRKIDELPTALAGVLKDGDVLLIQGAGSIGNMAAKLAAQKLALTEFVTQ